MDVHELEAVEPIVRASALAHVRLTRRDVAAMRRFLEDFGFRADADGKRFYGSQSPNRWSVEVAEGPNDALVGVGFATHDPDDLARLSVAAGKPVMPTDGDTRSRGTVGLTDPAGLAVDLIHHEADEVAIPPETAVAINAPGRNRRVNAPVRPPLVPATAFRLGHVVLERRNFRAAAQWYMRHFGLIPSDVQTLPDGEPALGFFRLDRGDEPTDHHSLAILGGANDGLLHISAEVADLDALGQGHQYLKARGWSHHWGIGRHELGSQLFDYWCDPAGAEWEHYADGDVMDAGYPTGYHPLSRGGLWTWGDDLPDSMRPRLTLAMLWRLIRATPAERRRLKLLKDAMSTAPRSWLR